jgi:hydroxymethylpyrimidine/phosphomethylpyrimidine kinase
MNKAELFYILTEMVEHAGISNILDEVIASMSTDELQETIKHLDQHLFANHFLTRED